MERKQHYYKQTDRVDLYGWPNNPYTLADARAVAKQFAKIKLPVEMQPTGRLYRMTCCNRIITRQRTERAIDACCPACGPGKAKEYSQTEKLEATTYETALALLQQFEQEQEKKNE